MLRHAHSVTLTVNGENVPVDAGYFFAPYVPLMQTPVIDLHEFERPEGMVGYNEVEVRTDYYGTYQYRNRCREVHEPVNWLKEGF